MKALAECLELIQGRTVEDFSRENPTSVLIGLGVITGDLQRNPKQAAGTMFINLSSSAEGASEQGPLFNMVFNIQKVSREVPPDGVYFGSGTENDLVVPDSSVSKTHAHLIQTSDGWSLVDHGSTNGTYINGSKVEAGVPQPLKGGDILTIGRLSFTFYDAVSFAKLLFVQAMAKVRARPSTPRTPGAARLAATPGRTSVATPGGVRATAPAPALSPNQSGAQAPWAQSLDADASGARSTGPAAGQPLQDWQQRALGRIPVGGVGSSSPGVTTTGGAAGASGVHAPAGSGHGGTTQPMTPAQPGSSVQPSASSGVPAGPPASLFKRLMLWISNFFQRLAGG